MSRRKNHSKSGFLEEIIYFVLKPPKFLFFVGALIFIIALFFNIDAWHWWVKAVNFLYLDKGINIFSSIFDAIIPK